MHLRINTLYPKVKVTQYFTQYPLYHVTYAPAKFEAATVYEEIR